MAYRPYRFPPLFETLAQQRGVRDAQQDGVQMAEGVQTSVAEGFQHGMENGYEAGFERGEEEGRRQGREEGVIAGAAEGREAVRAELAGVADSLDRMLEALRKAQDDYQTALRTELVELVGKVARQVIRCELALQPKQLLSLIDETLATMPASTDVPKIYLHPQECARVEELMPERLERWTLVADPQLDLGECRVRLGEHEADAGCKHRLDACIEQVKQQLQDASESESQEVIL